MLSKVTRQETDLSEVEEQKLLSNPKYSDFPKSNQEKKKNNRTVRISFKMYNLSISLADQTLGLKCSHNKLTWWQSRVYRLYVPKSGANIGAAQTSVRGNTSHNTFIVYCMHSRYLKTGL